MVQENVPVAETLVCLGVHWIWLRGATRQFTPPSGEPEEFSFRLRCVVNADATCKTKWKPRFAHAFQNKCRSESLRLSSQCFSFHSLHCFRRPLENSGVSISDTSPCVVPNNISADRFGAAANSQSLRFPGKLNPNPKTSLLRQCRLERHKDRNWNRTTMQHVR